MSGTLHTQISARCCSFSGWMLCCRFSEVELKEIKSLLLELNKKVDGLNDLVEERLIGYEEPTKEDVAAIKEYETAKKNGKLTLVPLSDLAKGI